MALRFTVLAATLLAAAAAAEAPPAGKSRPELRAPTGPVRITADRADLERREMALYRGNVRLVSAELELSGDRLELRQPARGEFQAVLTGRPARLVHRAVGEAPPIAASASRIVYDTRLARVEMSGAVQLARGSDTVSSEVVRYDVAARRISAEGTGGNPVRMVIEPPEPEREKPAAVPQNSPQQ
jgi:lipopolysaccharide export system protein LptA